LSGSVTRSIATTAIDVRRLRKTYPGGVEAVRGIDFRVAAGEVFGLLGPNGAGRKCELARSWVYPRSSDTVSTGQGSRLAASVALAVCRLGAKRSLFGRARWIVSLVRCASLARRKGDSMAEEISALTPAGVTIELRPTEAELGALVSAVVRIEAASRLPRPAFVGLLRLAREQQRR
jgi:hypothetical protein